MTILYGQKQETLRGEFFLPCTVQCYYILVDLYKGAMPEPKFLEEHFFTLLKNILAEGGLIGFNVLPNTLIKDRHLDTLAKKVFERVHVEYLKGPVGIEDEGNALLFCSSSGTEAEAMLNLTSSLYYPFS